MTSVAPSGAGGYLGDMKLPLTTTPLIAAILLAAMALAFVYQGLSEGSPPSFIGAAILFVGAVVAIVLARRRHRA